MLGQSNVFEQLQASFGGMLAWQIQICIQLPTDTDLDQNELNVN